MNITCMVGKCLECFMVVYGLKGVNMKEYNSYICMEVDCKNGYTGDWKTGINEALAVAQTNKIPVRLRYAGQIYFYITPDITKKELEELKSKNFIIGV